jgi:hypothetical protein
VWEKQHCLMGTNFACMGRSFISLYNYSIIKMIPALIWQEYR